MRRRGRWLLLLYVSVAAVLAAGATLPFLFGLPGWADTWNTRRPISASRQAYAEREIIGEPALAVLRDATAGSVVLLHDTFDDPANADGAFLQTRTLTERVDRKPLLQSELERLKSMLLSEKTYDFESDPNVLVVNTCAPIFRHRLVLTEGKRSLMVNFCFDCRILEFVVGASTTKHVDFNSDEFSRIFREHFPNDKTKGKIGRPEN